MLILDCRLQIFQCLILAIYNLKSEFSNILIVLFVSFVVHSYTEPACFDLLRQALRL